MLIQASEYRTRKEKYWQGEIVVVNLGENMNCEKSGVRPALVISNNFLNKFSENIIVAPITTLSNKAEKEILGSQLPLMKSDYKKIARDSLVQLEDIRSISSERVMGRLFKLNEDDKKKINNKLNFLLNFT